MAFERTRVALALVALTASYACGGETEAATAGRLTMDPAAKGGDDRNGPYDVVPGWWKAAPEHDSVWTWGSASGVWPDTPDRILVVMWGDERRTDQRDADRTSQGAGGGGAGRQPERGSSATSSSSSTATATSPRTGRSGTRCSIVPTRST
jgi:hypothetical protein